jgi:DNA-binding transcriptional regulator YiaG
VLTTPWYNVGMAQAQAILVAKARRFCATGIARERRQRARLSYGEVGAVVGVSRVTVYRWESGERSPHGEPAARYALFLEELVEAGAA